MNSGFWAWLVLSLNLMVFLITLNLTIILKQRFAHSSARQPPIAMLVVVASAVLLPVIASVYSALTRGWELKAVAIGVFLAGIAIGIALSTHDNKKENK